MHQFLFYTEFIILLYTFRAQPCSSPGGQNCITQHLASSHSASGRPMHRCFFNKCYTIIQKQLIVQSSCHVTNLVAKLSLPYTYDIREHFDLLETKSNPNFI